MRRSWQRHHHKPAIHQPVSLAGGEAITVIRARAIVRTINSSPSQQLSAAACRDTTIRSAIQKPVPFAGGEARAVIRSRALS
jgi:hypothetical protein